MLSDGSRHGRQHKAPTPAILHIPGLCISQKIPSAKMPVWSISIIEIRMRHDRIQAASVSMTADAGVHQV
jgi:hypothetical protein